MAKIFISYSRTDRNFVDFLVPQLRNVYGDGSFWYDTAIPGAVDWWKHILSEIQACQVFLFLMSDRSVQSENCQNELREALGRRKHVIQLLLPTLSVKYDEALPDDLLDQLRKEQYIDLRHSEDKDQAEYRDFSRLWGALHRLIDKGRLPLTTTERWMLYNQYVIMNAVAMDDEELDVDSIEKARTILAAGYEWDYEDVSAHIWTETMSVERCREVREILLMFNDLLYTYEHLDDKSDVDATAIHFAGFWGNNEPEELGYARYILADEGGYTSLPRPKDLNSHCPTLETYRRMLREWNRCVDRYNPTKEELIRIVDARYRRARSNE